MFIEHRTYTLKPGSTSSYISGYLAGGGLELHETMAPCVGWYTVEAGDLFRLVTMWKFDDMSHRAEARSRLNADPRWKALLNGVSPLVTDIRSQLLEPQSFWAQTERGRALLGS